VGFYQGIRYVSVREFLMQPSAGPADTRACLNGIAENFPSMGPQDVPNDLRLGDDSRTPAQG
jgi:hypothetical protein